MTDAVHLQAGGGLGDLIYTYFTKPGWAYLEPLKEKFPEVRTVGIIICHNSAATQLVELHPAIDAIMTHQWFLPGHKDECLWRDIVKTQAIEEFGSKNKLQKRQPRLVLTKEEEESLKQATTNPYVVVHPFAGLPHRGCLPHPYDGEYKCFPDYKYIESIRLLNDSGYNVIIVGRSERTLPGIRMSNEKLKISDSDKIVNAVNRTSLRLSVALTRAATGFLGSHSSMLSAAWTNDVPSVFFYPSYDEHGNYRSVLEHGGKTGTWAINKPWNSYYEMRSEKFLELDPEVPVGKLIENIKVKGE